MLAKQASLVLSPYSEIFEVVIPANHKLRLLKDKVDFSFIRKEVKDNYCLDNGRNAEDPVRMFKYLFLKCMYDLSDRGLMDRARTDMAFKYFLDLAPEADVIDPSVLSKFRRKRLEGHEADGLPHCQEHQDGRRSGSREVTHADNRRHSHLLTVQPVRPAGASSPTQQAAPSRHIQFHHRA